MARFNRRIVPKFIVLSQPYLVSDEKWMARGLLALLVGLMLANTAASVLLNQQTGEFSSALAARDPDRYWKSIYFTIGLLVVAVPIYGFYYYVRDKLTINWRRWMTSKFLDNYFGNKSFYKLSFKAEIDNPDQRIAEDINTFTQRSIYFLLIFIETFLQIVAFSGVLWSISRGLVFFLIAYATVGTLVTVLVFGRPLVGLNFFQLRREADFRYSLVRVRENAESIAFYRGEEQESRYVFKRFQDAFANYNRLINWQLFLNLFQYAYTSATLIIPGIILAPQVMSGDLEIGSVVQATGAFAAVFSALNVVVSKFDLLSLFAAGVGRLDRFAKALETTSLHPDEKQTRIETDVGVPVVMKSLSLKTPDFKRALVADLSMTLANGDGLLIVGASTTTERMERAASAFRPSMLQLRQVFRNVPSDKRSRVEALLDGFAGELAVRVQGAGAGHGPLHAHDCDQVLVVTIGRGYIEDKRGRHDLSPGSVVLVEAGEPHRHGSDENGHQTVFFTKAGYSTILVAEHL